MAQNTISGRSPKGSTPVLLFAVTKEISAVGGSVWLIQPDAYSTIIRAAIVKVNCRIIVPRPGEDINELPPEKNSHVVQTIEDLRSWLSDLATGQNW
ncbi:hypothetical protein [Larkinella ripae]